MLIGGAGMMALGYFGNFEDVKLQGFTQKFGEGILVGGVFAVILKSMQYLGVFKEAITGIIYEPKFLENRKDLPQLWEKMSTVIFSNKFPKISDKLLHDVKEMYFPTQEVIYYENAEHDIKYNIVNHQEKLVKVTTISSLEVVCESRNTKTFYEHGHSLDCKDYKLLKFKIDGSDVIKPEIYLKKIGDTEYQMTKTKLTGKERFKINLSTERIINLNEDDIYTFNATKIFNKLKVQIHFDKGLSFKFHSLGTLKSFYNTKTHDHFLEYVYDGLIYKKQGYFVEIKM